MVKNNGIAQQVQKVRLDGLYQRSIVASIGFGVAYGIYALFLTTKFDWKSVLSWYSVLLLIALVRWRMHHVYFRDRKDDKPQWKWLILFRLGIFAAGFTMGLFNLLFFSHDSISFLLIAILLPYGVALAAVQMLLDVVSFFIYVTTLFSPIIYQLLIGSDELYLGLSILTLVLAVYLLRFSVEYNKIFSSNTRLLIENSVLLENLQEEKNTLNNRLGRILNDSSNELYIVDAPNLNCLQFNKGALDNLGYSDAEMSKMTLDDIIVDLNKEEIIALVAPLKSGARDSLTYKTLQKRRDGSTYPVELRIQFSAQEDPPVYVVTALDITERDEAEKKLIHQANFDQLTNLPNRYYMLSYIRSAFARAKRQNSKVALLYIDLNNFKDINDTLGHATGDELLKMVAYRILLLLRETDTAARMGGDEFLLLLEGLNRQEQAETVVHKIISSFNEPFIINSKEIYTSASIGISTYPDDGNSVELLMQYADTAMYYAKKDSNTHYRFFSHELRAYIDEQLAIENRLRHAIKNDELFVYYQPKIDTKTERVVGAEALIRWQNSDLGMVPPSIFIPVAEKYGLIEEIGSWVIETACKEAVRWKEHSDCDLQVAVNISPRQFRSSNFLSIVDRALELSGLEDSKLEIEITENLLMQDAQEPMEILNELLDRNITLSLDDFGTGYSSLSYLKQFPLQVLKIDRSFINDMMENQYNMSLVDAIIAMAQILDLRLVAEGVETREQFEILKSRNVEVVQGYLFSPAIPAEKFRKYIQSS